MKKGVYFVKGPYSTEIDSKNYKQFTKTFTISYTNDPFIEQILMGSGFKPTTLDQLSKRGFIQSSSTSSGEVNDISLNKPNDVPVLPEKLSPPPPPRVITETFPPPLPPRPKPNTNTNLPIISKPVKLVPTQQDIKTRLEQIQSGDKCEPGFIKSKGKCIQLPQKREAEHFTTFANPQSLQEQSERIKNLTCGEGFERIGLKCVPLSKVLQKKMKSA